MCLPEALKYITIITEKKTFECSHFSPVVMLAKSLRITVKTRNLTER